MKTILEEEKERFWFEYISKRIPQDLHSIYSEDIMKMRGAFEAGIRFMVSFNSQHSNFLPLEKNDG